MEQLLADKLSKQLRIAPEQIVREEYELPILRDMFGSRFGPSLVFKGGTALRLAYQSPRFSDHLDFSVIKPINPAKFLQTVETISRRYPTISLDDAWEKRNTLLAAFKIKEVYLPLALGLKVELSTRPTDWVRDKDYVPQRLTSPSSNLVVLANTATLTRIYQDKLETLEARSRVRDVYDLWYLSAKLGKPFPQIKGRFSARVVRRDLNRLLPENERYVVEEIIKYL